MSRDDRIALFLGLSIFLIGTIMLLIGHMATTEPTTWMLKAVLTFNSVALGNCVYWLVQALREKE